MKRFTKDTITIENVRNLTKEEIKEMGLFGTPEMVVPRQDGSFSKYFKMDLEKIAYASEKVKYENALFQLEFKKRDESWIPTSLRFLEYTKTKCKGTTIFDEKKEEYSYKYSELVATMVLEAVYEAGLISLQ
ncbi:hypothetical protein [Bacillus paranthracis]|uniref:hypothetical protein n=1 Tax=Bacillus paranthracis TaxID=2026186 RepID=UPI00030C0720